MFFMLSKLLIFLISPTVWLLIGALSVIIWPPARKRGLGLLLVGLGLFTNPFLANEALLAWEAPPVRLRELGYYDAGILLTGITTEAKSPHDRVYVELGADRLLHTLWLYRAGRIRRILITGGSGAVSGAKYRTEAQELAILLRLAGVPTQHILLEARSRNTHENALNTRALLAQHPELRRTVLITSAFHMRRALGCFRKVGLQPASFPATYYSTDRRLGFGSLVPSGHALALWERLLHEMAGYAIYRVLGYA